jgi:N6-L-threonylcarbamoyladenine synthase
LIQAKNNSQITILGIESSCDDTSAAIWSKGKIRANVIASQTIHADFGGVVPEWASRKHQLNIVPTVTAALQQADMQLNEVDAIACTQGPGLMGSLLVGHSFTKGLAIAAGIPFINVDHIDAHILAHFIEDETPPLPFLCLLVSGGHTQIVVVREDLTMEILGKTIDDAAGEAFDKAGKMLNLDYPAGPIIDRLAAQGNPLAFKFATPRVEGLNFSFSGLKTSILYFLQKETKRDNDFVAKNINNLCASIQHTIVSYLINQLEQAMIQTKITHIGIAGGVAANSGLRNAIKVVADKYTGKAYIPALKYCTDNAGMIAFAGKIKLEQEKYGTLTDVCFARKG